MLIKYLNELEQAAQAAISDPTPERYQQCLDCVARLEAYLQSQLEPVRRKGHQIMDQLLPEQIQDWVSKAPASPPHHH